MALLPRLRRFAYGLTGRWDTADDLVQDTYLRAVEGFAGWLPGSRLDAWMYRIMRNHFLNQQRALAIRQEKSDALILHTPTSHGGAEATEARIIFERVRGAMAALPEDQRMALILVSVEGFSYKEVAELLNQPLGTIASRVGRAREALKPLVQSQVQDDALRPSRRGVKEG